MYLQKTFLTGWLEIMIFIEYLDQAVGRFRSPCSRIFQGFGKNNRHVIGNCHS